ncbi:MAG: helix-turn-helix domain-containing protein [Alphaproteobacteria bacterium]
MPILHDPIASLAARLVFRDVRRSAGLSMERLAEQMGLTYQQVQKYEAGSNRITVDALAALGRATSITLTDLAMRIEARMALIRSGRPRAS